MTTRLQKFIEMGQSGEALGRAAYVLDVSALPRPAKGKEWLEVLGGPGYRPRLEGSARRRTPHS
jgi:hypothetical protein